MDVRYDFTGKNVLITGAATGIGEGTALRFAEVGANIFIVDFNDDEGQKTAAACRDRGVKTGFFHTDVSDSAMVNAMAEYRPSPNSGTLILS